MLSLSVAEKRPSLSFNELRMYFWNIITTRYQMLIPSTASWMFPCIFLKILFLQLFTFMKMKHETGFKQPVYNWKTAMAAGRGYVKILKCVRPLGDPVLSGNRQCFVSQQMFNLSRTPPALAIPSPPHNVLHTVTRTALFIRTSCRD